MDKRGDQRPDVSNPFSRKTGTRIPLFCEIEVIERVMCAMTQKLGRTGYEEKFYNIV
jgi:hypothetical protein